MIICQAPKFAKSSNPSLRNLFQFLADTKRCEAPAVWKTAFGPRCEACMLELEASSNSDDTLLGMLCKREGITAQIPKIRIQ